MKADRADCWRRFAFVCHLEVFCVSETLACTLEYFSIALRQSACFQGLIEFILECKELLQYQHDIKHLSCILPAIFKCKHSDNSCSAQCLDL